MQWLNSLSSVSRPTKDADIVKRLLDLESVFTSPKNLRILELGVWSVSSVWHRLSDTLFVEGSGTGILALAVAALRSRIADAEDTILTTDLCEFWKENRTCGIT